MEVKCNIIINCHITMMGETVTQGDGQKVNDVGPLKGFPSALGRSLPRRIGKYFNSALMVTTQGAGSGIVAGTKVLKLIDALGAAKNIGIALLDSNGALIDLSSPSTAKIENNLQDSNTSLKFSAAYVTTADPKLAVAGRGDATLPFTLQYE
jgi:hypothetical protein